MDGENVGVASMKFRDSLVDNVMQAYLVSHTFDRVLSALCSDMLMIGQLVSVGMVVQWTNINDLLRDRAASCLGTALVPPPMTFCWTLKR